MQANISIVHRNYADDFADFCKMCSSAAPLLYRSEPGELNSPLAEDCDIRTDLPCYGIYEGSCEKFATDVKKYDWKEMVTFYIGCSFSFEEAFLKNNIPIRNIERNTDVGIYRTNIRCLQAGPFSGKLIVSMRPMPKRFVSLAADITSRMPDVHGAPIHIGNPAAIGILNFLDTSHSDGGVDRLLEGDIPVFWGCGITTLEALKFSNCALSVTNSDKCLLFTDVLMETPNGETNLPDREKCAVIEYFERFQGYSLLSAATMKILKELNSVVNDDQGNQDVSQFTDDEFIKNSLALSHSKSVALTLPYYVDNDQHKGMDSPLSGIISLSGMLQALGKDVTLLVDERGIETYKYVAKEVKAGISERKISLIPLKTDNKGCLEIQNFMNEDDSHRYDVVLVMEGDSRVNDDKYRSILELVESFTIKGVSNWGCLGLAFALFALRNCQIHDRYYRKGVGLPTNARQQFGWAIPTVQREQLNLEIVQSESTSDKVKKMTQIIAE